MSGKSQASRIAAAPEHRPADATGGLAGERRWASKAPAASRPAGARHSSGDLGGAPLVVGKPDDAYEIEAERAADRALVDGRRQGGSSELTPARPGLLQRRANANAGAARGLPQQLGSAASEARPLPATQRSFFEQRLGHDFGAVRIHDGPASAAAAASVGAQAFAHGQNVYFGAGEYRPNSRPGQWLIAHELAHTVQQRPNVIARRAMVRADPSLPALSADAPAADSQIDDAADALADVGGDKAAQGGPLTKDKLRNLDTPSRIAVLARVQSSVPSGQRQEIAGRLDVALGERAEAGEPAVKGGARAAGRAGGAAGAPRRDDAARQQPKEGGANRGVELQSPASAAPAPTQQMPGAAAAATPAPRHERAIAAAATKTKQAIQVVSTETPVEAEGDPSGAAGVPGPSAATDRPAAATGAQAAAGEAMALMSAQLGQLGAMRSVRPRFQMDPNSLSRDPREALGRQESDGLAAGFVDDAAKQVEAVIAAGTKFPAQALASLAEAKGVVAAAVASQIAVVRDGAAASHKKVEAQSRRAHALIEGARAHADGAAEAAAKSARDRAKTAYETARKGVNEKGDDQAKKIDRDFEDAKRPLAAVGLTAGHQAWLAMEVRKREYLSQKNGESTILDGSYHDDQCDARADAAEQVHDEYKKSMLKSAKEQADNLPKGKPEVLGKVADITKKLADGLNDQFKNVGDSIDAFEKGAKAQARQTAVKIKGSLVASATQSLAAIDKTADEQTQQIAAQGESQQNSLDQAAQSALAAVAGGVAQAGGQMVESIGQFIASAAAMPPPPGEELAPTLAQAAAQAAAGVDTMRAQLDTAGPTLAANLDSGAQSASEGLAAAAKAVCQGLDQTADAFTQSAAGTSQQAASGFRSLSKGNDKTAKGIGDTAEEGFKKAQDAATESFSGFSKAVQDTFADGRQQLLASLWSKETQTQLDEDIKKYAEQAADQVQPRWKKVLKWVITIVIVLAVIAITVASAGSLGPVGVILLGAALGAAAGAVQTIANNLIDGKKWSDGVVKAMIVGAISGAIGGAGGVVLKGVGTVGIKIALEAGINVIGGVTADAIGSAAVGDTFNFESALVGALVGAGIGAGLGIAGALKGKIRFGSFGGEPPVAPPRPAVEPPAAPAPGKVRSFLEQTKILAPRSGAAVPEINVGGTAGGDAAPPAPSPAPKSAAAPGGGETGAVASDTAAASRPAADPTPRPTTEAPRPVSEPPAPRPAPASETPPPQADPAVPRPQSAKPVPDNVRPIESAEPGRAGDQPQLRTQRPMTTAEEFAARQRARAGGQSGGGEPPDVESQVQRQPVAQAAGAEGFTPRPLESVSPAESGGAGGRDAAGERSPLEIRASGEPPGAGRPRPGPSASRGEGPRPLRGGGGEPIGSGGRSSVDVEASAMSGGKGPGASKPGVPEGGVAEPGPAKTPAGAPAKQAAKTGGLGETEAPAPREKPTPSDRRAGIEESKARVDAKAAAKRQAKLDARAAAAERARRAADSAAMQREFHGEVEGPRRNPTIDEISLDEGFGSDTEEVGGIGREAGRRGGRLPSGDLPEPPAFPESVDARGARESLDFFKANHDNYPKEVRDLIDAARPGSAASVKKIDFAIRAGQARAGNRALGFPAESQSVQAGIGPSGRPVIEPSSPFTATTKGHTPLVPGAEFERGATLAASGEPKNLTFTGQTRTTGETVQIDDFNFASKTPKEIKMPLALKNDPRFFANNQESLIDQMRRQAQFARDWNFSRYMWEMHSAEDLAAAEGLRDQLPPDLAKWIQVTRIQ
jgi:hypothetical protein